MNKVVNQKNKLHFLIVSQQLRCNTPVNTPTPSHNTAGRCRKSEFYVNLAEAHASFSSVCLSAVFSVCACALGQTDTNLQLMTQTAKKREKTEL